MNIRSTLLMFALSIAALWVFGLMLAYKKLNVEEGAILPSFKSVPESDIESVTIEFKDEKQNQVLEFKQLGGNWTFGKNEIKIDGFQIDRILKELKSASKKDDEKVPPDAGMDSPRITVTILGKKGSWQVKIGKSSNDKVFDYVKTSELPKVVAVEHTQLESLFFTNINAFRSKQPFSFQDLNVKRVDIKQLPNPEKLPERELEIKKTDDDLWKFLVPKELGYASAEGATKPKETVKPKKKNEDAEKEKEKDEAEATGGVRLLLKNIGALRIDTEDFIDPSVSGNNLGKYGLDEKGKLETGERPWLRIEVAYTSGFGKEEARDSVLLVGRKDPDKEKYYFCRMADDLGVFRLSGKSLEPMKKAVNNPEELRSRDILFTKIDKIDFLRLVDRNEYLLSHPAGKPWQMFFAGKWVKANGSAVQERLEALAKGAIVDFATGSDSEHGFDQPKLTICMTADAKPKEQKNPAPPAAAKETARQEDKGKAEDKKDEKKSADKKDDKAKGEDKKDDKKPADKKDDKAKADDKKPADKKDDKAKVEDKKDDKAKTDEKFAIEVEPGVLERKDWSTEAIFKNGKVKSAAPSDDKLVKTVVDGSKVRITQIGDADKEDKTVEIKVKGGKDDKEEIVLKVTVRKKPTVTLIFGKLQTRKINDKEVWSVKRILEDGAESRFYLAKELVDKIIPSDAYLAFLDNALPTFSVDDATVFKLERNIDKKKESLDLYRTKAMGWLFNNPSVPENENVADPEKVERSVGPLGVMQAVKWVQEIDAKDLKQFGLDQPQIKAVVVVKKTRPVTIASAVGLFGSGARLDTALLASSETLKDWLSDAKGQPLDAGQTFTIIFGKEGEKDGSKGVYALLTVGEDKGAATGSDEKVRTNSLLFLANLGVFTQLKTAQYHDRSEVLTRQTYFEARTIFAAVTAAVPAWSGGSLIAAEGSLGSLAGSPFMNPTLLSFDAAKVEKIAIEIRQQELRKFTFLRDEKAAAAKTDKKDDAKNTDSKTEPVSLKGQTWKDASGLNEFTVDSENINALVEKLARVQAKRDSPGEAVRLVSFEGSRAYQKLGPKESTIRLEIYVEGSPTPITVVIGAKIDGFHFATCSQHENTVFLVRARFIDDILKGIAYFGKLPVD